MKKPKDHTPSKPHPTMWETEKSSVKKTSLKNERRLSLELGFDLTPGSGNTRWITRKGDGNTSRFMVECKETKGKRLVISEEVLTKLCREASAAGKEPLLVVSVYGLAEPLPKDWVIIPAFLLEK